MTVGSTSQYAFRAVLYIAEHGAHAPVRVDDIAAVLRVPRNYLSKTLHALARAGTLTSARGPRGGFQLARPASEISFAEIAAPFDDLGERRCLLGRAQCGWKNPCTAHARWEAVSSSISDFFRHTTVADLLGDLAGRAGTTARGEGAPDTARRPARKPARKGARKPARGPANAPARSAARSGRTKRSTSTTRKRAG